MNGSAEVYRMNRKLKMKDEELPFTNVNFRTNKEIFGSRLMEKSLDILQKTYYNVAHPPNRHPLSKDTTQFSLATTCDTVNKVKTTKYCKYSEDYIKALEK